MSYVRKLMAQDEKLIGIARLHWIYVLKGILWFVVMAGAGWLFNRALSWTLVSAGRAMESSFLPITMGSIGNGVMLFLMAGGFFVFLLFVIDVLTTEIGLSNRRVMHKRGLIFVKVKQIDLEEVRGENIDLGYFGRMLGYGYIMLDCRFIGDVKLPAIENPERFMRALHAARSTTQDTLNVVVGKGKAPYNLNVVGADQNPQTPQPAVPEPEIKPSEQPVPEVQPDQPHIPEMPTRPTPHSPPPSQTLPPQPTQPVPPPAPTPAPGPDPQPPLQPPTGTAAADPQAVAQAVAQVMPQMAQEVAKQLIEQGIIEKPAPENDNQVDNDIIADFDDARLKDTDPHEVHDKMEHAIH